MNLIISLLSGIIAAFTPCVIVLIPILLYRFFNEEKNDWKNFIFFIVGFLISYIIFGYLLLSIFTSFVQNGIKIGVGILFVIVGILAIFNKLNPFNFPFINNVFLLGIIFSLIISLNPCTLPYLGLIVSINSNNVNIFLNLIFYGLGLILPAILFSIFGKKILKISKKNKKIFSKVNNLMHYILILSGIYLIYTIKSFNKYDIYVTSLFLVMSFILILRAFFVIHNISDLFKLKNIFLFLLYNKV